MNPDRIDSGARERDDAPSTPQPFAYTAEQGMALLNVDRRRFYQLIAEGALRTYKHGRRRYVSAEALRDCVRVLEQRYQDTAK